MKEYIIQATESNGYSLTHDTLNKFLGIIMLSIINSRKSVRDNWSTKSVLCCPIVENAMSRNEFLAIKKHLKFYTLQDKKDNDKVWKVRHLYNLFRQNAQQFGWFSHILSIDEVMVKYFGHFGIKQCIRNKPIRFGIKLWTICSNSGYIFDFNIYTGKSSEENDDVLKNATLGSRVVLQMLGNILTSVSVENLRAYEVYFDNFFTSPDLMVHLKRVGLSSTGTKRQNRVKTKTDLPKNCVRGTCCSMCDKSSNLNCTTVMDAKPVSILSTACGVEPKIVMKRWVDKSRQSIHFPNVFSQYNKKMGGVDLHDQHCNAVLPAIRGKKWTWCLFVRLLQMAITNATVLYNEANPEYRKGTKDVVEEICQHYLQNSARTKQSNKRKRSSNSQTQTNHTSRIGEKKKCTFVSANGKQCNKRTDRLCQKCAIHLCSSHGTTFGGTKWRMMIK